MIIYRLYIKVNVLHMVNIYINSICIKLFILFLIQNKLNVTLFAPCEDPVIGSHFSGSFSFLISRELIGWVLGVRNED